MAEFALGLTKSAVEGTVSRVKAAIDEETKLRVRVQNDLVFITGEFQMMQSFLNVANRERAKNEVVRTWVRQIRDLAFEVEDCVELVVSLDVKSGWSWLWRVLPGCMAPSRPLDDAVARLEQLKARVAAVSDRNTRYNLITSGDGGGDDNNHHSDQQMLTQTAVGSASYTAAATFHVLRKMWKDKGKLHDTVSASDLKRLIDCRGSELQVISLWGSPQADAVGELGWNAIVKKAYDDPSTCREFKNRAWIKPTQPFNQVEFLNTLMTHFQSHLHHRRHDDMSELVLQVSQQKYLIILEQELSSVADWEAIRLCLPDGNKGSRIIISTRHLGLALACTREPYQVWELRRFFHDQYLYAFFPKGSGHRMGMGEFLWQLRRPGVISVLWDFSNDRDLLMKQLSYYKMENWRIPNGVEFEHIYWHEAKSVHQTFNFADLVDQLLRRTYPKDEINDELEQKFTRMSSQDKIERCRKHLSEHKWLICIENLHGSSDWDLIKRDLLPDSTRGCIVVITYQPSVATQCVDNKSRALNARDLIKGFDEQDHLGGIIETDVKYELDELLGRDDELLFLKEWKDFHAVTLSFWGIAGVGKTAIVKTMYNTWDQLDYRMSGWVDVPDPFNLSELCRRLLMDFYSYDTDEKETAAVDMMEGQDPIQGCCKILHENKCLLVIDGLRSTRDWDILKATLLSNPSTVAAIVITREESIATHCTDNKKDAICNVKGLKDDLVLDLFKKIALDDGEQLPSHQEENLNILIPKCGGLPGIVVDIGGVCRHAGLGSGVLEDVNASFIPTLERILGLRGLFQWMQSYFNACSDELKPCIFYMSVFPADQGIRCRRLLRRWIAEGYSSATGGTTDDIGDKLLSELMELSILYQEQQTSTITSYKVNGFFREYIKSRPMEDNLVFALEGSCSASSRLTGQHLTISSCWDRDVNVFNEIDFSRLRSLTVSGEWRLFLICDKMKILRVLDLEGTSTSDVTTSVTDDVLEQIVKLLPRLKFLSLRGCVHITRLPDSLSDMRQLETLDARHTSIAELTPASITKLHKLQYISVGTSTDTSHRLLQTKISTPQPAQPPQEDSHGDAAAESAVQEVSTKISGGCRRRTQDLVASSHDDCWQFKNDKDLRTRRRVAANGGGVEVGLAAAKGIGRLTYLRTLGVVNVAGGKGPFLFLKALKTLTQLGKLGLSGITRENWRKLCDAITGNLRHLESLSLQLMLLEEGGSFDFACFDNIDEPPKTLRRLKVLYTTTRGHAAGGACIRPVWLNKFPKLAWRPTTPFPKEIKTFDHELMISSLEDLCLYVNFKLPLVSYGRLRVKLLQQEHLSFDQTDGGNGYLSLDALRIDCSSSSSTVIFGKKNPVRVEAISIHCCSSCGSSSCLRISGLQHVRCLREVRVTGPCSQGLKEDLLKQLSDHWSVPSPKLLIGNQ